MKKIIFLFFAVVTLVSCSTTKTMSEQYPDMYEEKPLSIVVMPPINQTTHAEAKDYFYSTMYLPLCERGYYVFSPYLTMDLFQQESAYDSELFIDGDLSQFQNVLSADAAMFTIIKDWRRNNVGGRLTVDIEYRLRSCKTGKTLWSRQGKISVDTSINAGGGLFGALASMVATAVNTAATDKVVAGRKCNAHVLMGLPAGKYSPNFEKDAQLPAGKQVLKGTVK